MPGLPLTGEAPARSRFQHVWAAGAAMLVTAWLLHGYYDKTWYPPDEGNYATVAQRVLQGEILNLQVQDIHPGYVTFVNAAALRIFGVDLLSLRYPLVLAGLLQAAALLLVFPTDARWRGAAAVVAGAALSEIQFLNPTAHWPCLALTAVLVALLTRTRKSAGQLVAAGVLIGTIALFRQLTGFFVGLGTLTFVLSSLPGRSSPRPDALIARIVLTMMIVALSVYLVTATDVSGVVLFGVWPIALLARLLFRPQPGNGSVLQALGWIALGIGLAAVPLLTYHIAHGSLHGWANDIGPAAVALTRLDFFQGTNFGALVVQSIRQTLRVEDVASIVNGLYWVALAMLATVNGVLVHRSLSRSPVVAIAPLPVVSVFYALVSVHYQIPLYLYFSAALSLASVLWLAPSVSAWSSNIATASALFLGAVGLICHAGQPTSRRIEGVLRGERHPPPTPARLPHCSLEVDEDQAGRYRILVDLIRRRVGEQETIFAVPSNAELYFLSQRRNPFRFYNTALGVRSETDLATVRDLLREHPPRLVTFNPSDKYNTARSLQIMEDVRSHYVLLDRIDPFEIYVLP